MSPDPKPLHTVWYWLVRQGLDNADQPECYNNGLYKPILNATRDVLGSPLAKRNCDARVFESPVA